MADEIPPSRRALRHELPIAEVTLMEDRAHVGRRARWTLPAGVSRIQVAGVSPVLVDRTLCAGIAGGGARVADVQVVRRAAGAALDDADVPAGGLEELERERERLGDAIAQAAGARDGVREEIAALDRVAQLGLGELAVDAAWGKEPPAESVRALDELAQKRLAARERLVGAERAVARLAAERERLDRRIRALATPSTELEAELVLDVVADEAGSFDVSVDYLVPGACWRPYHRAELRDGKVRFQTDACVWQNTGEAWRDARLTFSTERASLGTEPPELGTDLLRVRKKSTVLQVETRERAMRDATVAGPPGETALPGIDDGGAALELTALARSSVPSDGRPHRVPLAEFVADARQELVSFPELAACAILKTTQVNASSRPILAGPVDLIRSSGLAGRTMVLFVGPDERFELGWGPDPDICVQRDVEVREDDAGLLGSWIAQAHKVEVRLSNLGAAARHLVVRERVPVSEIEKVKIEAHPNRSTGGRAPDDDGFVAWEVDLAAHGHEDIVLRYTLKRHTDVVGL
jgi:uncharacterized protein (TIGR02231 family)